jgi:SAM-dependent methyltransferase
MITSFGPPCMLYIVLSCPMCREQKTSVEFGKGYLRCRKCKVVYAGAEFTSRDLEHYYANYYNERNSVLAKSTLFRYKEIVLELRPFRSFRNTILEIGCGTGDLLHEFAKDGWQVFGSEVSLSAKEQMQKRNIDNLEINFDNNSEKDLYDAILLFEVIEHVQDPIALIDFCFRNLRKGGVLYGTTPNSKSLNSRILGPKWSIYGLPEHLTVFSPLQLQRAFRKIGFEKNSVVTKGLNPFDIIQMFTLWGKFSVVSCDEQLNRVQYGQYLNDAAHQRKSFRIVKKGLNTVFAKVHFGDSILFKAIK